MKILDWYILKKFIVTFVFVILMFTVIAVVIDASEKTDDFVKSGLSFWQIVTQYFAGFVPFIIAMIFPIIIFIAVIFFTSKMAGRSEIVAILANGVNFNRLLKPYIMGGVFFAAILWIGNHYIIPKANGIYSTFKAKYIDHNYYSNTSSPSNYMRVDAETFISFSYYDKSSNSANQFALQRIKGNKMYYSLRGSFLKWNEAKRTWKLENVIERKINGLKEEVKHLDSMNLKIPIQPKDLDLRRDEYAKDKFTTPELDNFIRQEELRGTEGLNALKIERYRRDATAFSIIILTIIGVSVASRKTRGGSGLHLASGIIAAALFVITDRFSTVFSTKGNMPPLLAAWTPNIIFGIVAYIRYRKAPK